MFQENSALYPQYFERYKALKFVYFVTMKVFFVASAEAIVYLMSSSRQPTGNHHSFPVVFTAVNHITKPNIYPLEFLNLFNKRIIFKWSRSPEFLFLDFTKFRTLSFFLQLPPPKLINM